AIIDGTPRAYAFMLAGYTASIISFPSVDNPTAIFDNALARAEEISLGIVCVVFVSYFPMAERVGPLLQRQLGRWIAD
ncbi:FUSC family protein, partial [Salmonella sp. M307]|uniref:FUSC family protein n=1 Tax=Salmonella sp. M307 TaxID=3240310 RepID=UPI00352A396B